MTKTIVEFSGPYIEIYLAPLNKESFDKIRENGVPSDDDYDQYNNFRDFVESYSTTSSFYLTDDLQDICITVNGENITLDPKNFITPKLLRSKAEADLSRFYYLEIGYGTALCSIELDGKFDKESLIIELSEDLITPDRRFVVYTPQYKNIEFTDSTGSGSSYVEAFLIDENNQLIAL